MAYKMMHNGWTVMALRLYRYGVTALITVQDRDEPLWAKTGGIPVVPKWLISLRFLVGAYQRFA